ncbi:MAG: hypothetical protein L0Z73_14555 [Gammaproteobacteria bacterium]|nr:hypothetical protein [Gammaproteobacteria bacterium]
MTAIASNIPDGIFYHFAVKQQSVDELFNTLYDRPTEIAWSSLRPLTPGNAPHLRRT